MPKLRTAAMILASSQRYWLSHGGQLLVSLTAHCLNPAQCPALKTSARHHLP